MSPAPIALDFVARRRWPGLLGWLLLALGLAMAGLEVRDFLERRADLAEREQIVARLRHQLERERRVLARTPETPVRAEEATPALKLSAQLGRDWPGLFATLAEASGKEVALLSVAPDGLRGVVNLTAEADDLEAMFDFLGRLEASAVLRGVQLVSYEHEGARFAFNFTAQWGLP